MNRGPVAIDRRTLLRGAVALAASACAPATADRAGEPGPLGDDTRSPGTTPDHGSGTTAPTTTAPAATTGPATTGPATTGTAARTDPAATGTTAVGRTDLAGGIDASGRAAFVQRGPGVRPEVALTFHTNGEPALVTRLLDRLAARRVPITAFVIGDWLDEHPDLARRLVADGHEPANHSWSHPAMAELDRAAIRDEIERCAVVLQRLTGSRGEWFRPSAMDVADDDVRLAAADAGYATVIGFSLDSRDHTDPGAAAVVEAVTSTIAAGDIVSLHFDHPGTISAIDPIVDHLERVGLRPVTVSRLLAR